jgi:single-strand DNA-binding protein
MARGLNKVSLIGNLGRDPEVQSLDNNVKRATFTLATTEISRDKEGHELQHTEWHNIVLWRGLAEVAELYLHKGSQVYIEGRLRTRSFEGKDGVKRYVTEIQADNLIMVGARRESDSTSGQYAAANHAPAPVVPVTPVTPAPSDIAWDPTTATTTSQANPEDDLPF